MIEAVLRGDGLAERQRCAKPRLVAAGRIPLVPFRGREAAEELADLSRERRRRDRFRQQPQSGALKRLLRSERRAYCAKKCRPRADVADVGEGL